MAKCIECENIFRKKGVTISKCGKRLNTIPVVPIPEIIAKDEIKKPVSRYLRNREVVKIEEENYNE